MFGAGAFPKPTQRSQSLPSKSSLLDLPTIHIPSGHILGVTAPFPTCAGAGWRSRAAFGGSVGFCGSAVPWGVTPGPSAVPAGVTALASRSGILSPLPWQGEGSNLGFPLFPFASSFLIYRFHFFGGQQPGRDPGLFWRSRYYPFLVIPKGSPIPCATVIYFFSSPLIFFPPKPSWKFPK